MAYKYQNHFQFLSWIKYNCTVDSIYAAFIVLTILKLNGARRSFAKSNEAKINPTWLSPSACFVAIVLKNGNGNEFAAYPNRFTRSSVNKNKILLCPAIFSSVFFNAFAVLEESIAASLCRLLQMLGVCHLQTMRMSTSSLLLVSQFLLTTCISYIQAHTSYNIKSYTHWYTMEMINGSMNWLLISTVKAGRVDGVLMDVDVIWYVSQHCYGQPPMMTISLHAPFE